MQLTPLKSKREVLTKTKRIEVKVSLAKLQKSLAIGKYIKSTTCQT